MLANYISEKVWHPKQKILMRPGGRIELSLPVADTRDIESWVLSLGELMQVIALKKLRDAVRERQQKIGRPADDSPQVEGLQ